MLCSERMAERSNFSEHDAQVIKAPTGHLSENFYEIFQMYDQLEFYNFYESVKPALYGELPLALYGDVHLDFYDSFYNFAPQVRLNYHISSTLCAHLIPAELALATQGSKQFIPR